LSFIMWEKTFSTLAGPVEVAILFYVLSYLSMPMYIETGGVTTATIERDGIRVFHGKNSDQTQENLVV
jgi:hypothetical protein